MHEVGCSMCWSNEDAVLYWVQNCETILGIYHFWCHNYNDPFAGQSKSSQGLRFLH